MQSFPQSEISKFSNENFQMQPAEHSSADEAFVCALDDISTPFPAMITPETSTTIHPKEIFSEPNTRHLSRRNHQLNDDCITVIEPWTDTTYSPEAPGHVDATIGGDCQSIFNTAVATARVLSNTTVCTDPSLNQDALIRGILFGWDVATTTCPFRCPLWGVLQLLDKRIFQFSGTITRLCTLRMIHSLLLVNHPNPFSVSDPRATPANRQRDPSVLSRPIPSRACRHGTDRGKHCFANTLLVKRSH